MKILITGGLGFIGSNIIQKLIFESHDITVIDDLSSNRKQFRKDIRYFNLSTDDKKCEEIFRETTFDIVIYLAFRGYCKDVYNHKSEDIYKNNAGLNNILFLSHKYKVKKVIGLTSYLPYHTTEGKSYLARERLFEEYRELGLKVIELKVGAVYGPGQYGVDSQFITEILNGNTEIDMDEKKEYIYIKDLCEAVIKVIENDTMNSLYISSGVSTTNKEIYNIYSKYLSSRIIEKDKLLEKKDKNPDLDKTIFSIDWVPKTNIVMGISKTIDWYKKNPNIEEAQEEEAIKDSKKTFVSQRKNKSIDIGILLILSSVAHYISQYKYGIKIDFLLLYIIFINLLYGFKEGIMALGLSILTTIFFKFNFEGKTVLMLSNDLYTILYFTMYGVISVSIGYLVDVLKGEKKHLSDEIDYYKGEMNFLKELYNKSIEVKNNLQFNIENYEDNFSKTFNIVESIDKQSMIPIFDGVVDVYSSVSNSKNVSLYKIDSNNDWLRLISYLGDGKYGHSINIKEDKILNSIIKGGQIYLNKEFIPGYPTMCIPIAYGEKIRVIVFIDDIEFNSLTQSYLNSLRVITRFISSSISSVYGYEKAIFDKRYYSNTVIMKKDWFHRLIQEKLNLNEAKSYGIVMIKILNKINDYESFNNTITKLIRSNDILGEVEKGQLGLIPSMVVSSGISSICERLSRNGINTEVLSLGGE